MSKHKIIITSVASFFIPLSIHLLPHLSKDSITSIVFALTTILL